MQAITRVDFSKKLEVHMTYKDTLDLYLASLRRRARSIYTIANYQVVLKGWKSIWETSSASHAAEQEAITPSISPHLEAY